MLLRRYKMNKKISDSGKIDENWAAVTEIATGFLSLKKFYRNCLFSQAISILFLVFSSCATSYAGLSLSDIPLEGKEYHVVGPAEGRARWITIDMGLIAFPLSAPPIDRVLDQARKSGGGNALRNIRYTQDEIVILFVHIHRLYLRGDAVQVTDPDNQKPAGRGR